MATPGIAYLLWLLCFLGLNGIHRFYLGKPITGFLSFITFGGLYIWQFIDLFLIPRMVVKANRNFGAGLPR